MSKTTLTPLPDFLSGLEALGRQLADSGPDWLRRLRRDGLDRVGDGGLPTTDDEAWRSTRLDGLLASRFGVAEGGNADSDLDFDGVCLTFVDGRYDEGRSRRPAVDGLWYGRLDEALETHGNLLERVVAARTETAGIAFESLNDALFEDAVVIRVARGATIEPPIHVRHLVSAGSDPIALHTRLLIVAEDSAQAVVVESFEGDDERAYFTNAVTQVELGDAARIDHYRLQDDGAAATHIGTSTSRQGRDSRYRGFNLALGAKLCRMHVTGTLDGEGADCQLYGLYVPHGEQHVDSHTVLDHAKPHGDSRELYKGVLCDRGRSVFSGRIVVREDAQKTDAKQSNPNLLLSPHALAQTRPQLEIYADDVRCTHGATVGEMDADAIFYLRSRGIAELDARHLLIQAFSGEVTERIELESLRDRVEAEVARRLPRR